MRTFLVVDMMFYKLNLSKIMTNFCQPVDHQLLGVSYTLAKVFLLWPYQNILNLFHNLTIFILFMIYDTAK